MKTSLILTGHLQWRGEKKEVLAEVRQAGRNFAGVFKTPGIKGKKRVVLPRLDVVVGYITKKLKKHRPVAEKAAKVAPKAAKAAKAAVAEKPARPHRMRRGLSRNHQPTPPAAPTAQVPAPAPAQPVNPPAPETTPATNTNEPAIASRG